MIQHQHPTLRRLAAVIAIIALALVGFGGVASAEIQIQTVNSGTSISAAPFPNEQLTAAQVQVILDDLYVANVKGIIGGTPGIANSEIVTMGHKFCAEFAR